MRDLKFKLPGNETVTLTGQTIDNLICAGDGDAALLYLYILKTHAQCSAASAAKALKKSASELEAAMSTLARLGLVQLGDYAHEDGVKTPPVPPAAGMQAGNPGSSGSPGGPAGKESLEDLQLRHSVSDMQRELNSGSAFSHIVEEAQRSLGKILSPEEALRLFGMYDSLKMEPEVILHLITHCISESRIRGSGRMPSIRYIEKAAYTWEREGIVTLDCAEKYLKELDNKRSMRGEMKIAMQITGRQFTETEARYVDGWISMGFGPEAIAIAYDRTVVKTGKLAWKYMDSIINSWYNKKLMTPEDIINKDKRYEKNGSRSAPRAMSEKFGSADEEEMLRLQKLLDKTKVD